MGMVGEACLPSNAYYPRTPDYTLYSGIPVCWSEHSESSFVYGFMSFDYGLGTMTTTTYPSLDSMEAVGGTCNRRRLWSDCADAQADLSLRWEHTSYCRFWRALAHIMLFKDHCLGTSPCSHLSAGSVQGRFQVSWGRVHKADVCLRQAYTRRKIVSEI